MQKILITIPNSIAGTLIMNGFNAGFKSNGCYTALLDLKTLRQEDIERFKPDVILGYDYGYLFSDDEGLKAFIKDYAKKNNTTLVHYFADEPDGKYAYVNKTGLYEEFKALNDVEGLKICSFVWDRDFVGDLPNAAFLPLAVNYKAYRTDSMSVVGGLKYDVTFVGRPLTDKRQKILAALVRAFGKRLSIFSYEKHFLQSLDDMRDKHFLNENELDIYKSAYKGFLKTEADLADVYFNSKVNLNITLQGKSGLNYRVFEVLASRGFLITDDLEDISRNFIASKELETYKDVPDLIDKVDFYLKNHMIAQKIAIIGFADVIKRHSYTARARSILESLREN